MNRCEYIVVNDGIEGFGKFFLMIVDNFVFIKCGGKFFIFFGYDVYDDDGKIIFEKIDIVVLFDFFLKEELRNVCVLMDEMENWFDN